MINFSEEQILSLKFDSTAFVEGVDDAIDIIKSLNNTIKTFKDDSSTVGSRLSSVFNSITSVLTVFSKHSEGLLSDIFKNFSNFSDNLNSEADSVDFSKINTGLENTGHKFSAFEELVRGIFIRLGGQITDFVENKLKLLTVDQMMSGWEKYQTLVQKTQTMMATGADEEEVTTALRQLAWYADETSYSLQDMVANLSKFVSYGISVGDAATEIMGIDNAVAKAGSSIQQATSAQEAFARAFSMGFMSLSVWRHQLTTSGLITEDFKNKCIEAGLKVGTLYRDVNGVVRSVNKNMEVTATGMENTLTKAAWMTNKVMETMLKGYAASTKEIEYIYQNTDLTTSEIMEAGKEFFDQYSLEAFQMGQEAITLKQSIESLWDAMSTQWANIFTNIFGTYKDAKRLWTDLANWLNKIFVGPFYDLVDFTAGFKTTLEEDGGFLVKYRKLVEEECGAISNVFTNTSGTIQEALREGFLNILRAISSYVTAFKLAWSSVFNSVTIQQVGNLVGSFTNFTEKLILSDDQVIKLATHLSNLFKVLKIIKDIIVEIYEVIKDFLWPLIKKGFESITPILDGVSESLSNILTKVQSFLKTTFGIDFKNTSVYKEFQRLNDSSANLLENIDEIKKKLKEYRKANPDITSVEENLTGLESKIKDINALTEAASMSKLTDFDIEKLQALTDSLSNTSGYLDKGSSLLKEYTEALDKLKDQGYATYENLEKLNSIIKEINGELNKNYIFEDLNNINWSNLTEDDIKNLRAYNEQLKSSEIYVSELGELSEKYKQKLESIGKAGKVTASDLKELNDILDKMSDTQKTQTELAKTNDEIIALQYAIDKLKSKDKIEEKDLLVLDELYKRLEKAEKESDNSSKSLDDFSKVLKEIGKNSELTASDIDKISDALDKLKSKVDEENKKESDLEKKRRERNERMQRYNEALASSQGLTDEEKIIFWGQYYKEESKNRRKETEELRKQNRIKKEANAITKESVNALKSTVNYSSNAFKNVNKLSSISSNISKTVGNINEDVDKLNENSKNTSTNLNENKKSVDELTESSEKLDETIKDVDETAKKSEVSDKIDGIKESSKDAETWASKLATGLKEIFTSNEIHKSKEDVSNSISDIGDKLAEASKNAENVDGITKNKTLSKYINDWLGQLNISKGNILKVVLGVSVFVYAVKKIYEDLGEIAKERPEIFDQASNNIIAMGLALLEVSVAISLITASEYLFGNSEKAIKTITKIFKLMRNTLFAEFLAIGLFNRRSVIESAIVFSAMGFALLEAAAAIAIISNILNKNKNAEQVIDAVKDIIKYFKRLILEVILLSKETSSSTILTSAILITSFSTFVAALGLALYLIGKVSSNFKGAYTVILGIVDVIKAVGVCISAFTVLTKAGNEKELIACAFVLLAFSTVILSIGISLGIISYVQNKYGSTSSESLAGIVTIIHKIKNTLSELTFLALFAKDDRVFFKVEKVIFAFSACLIAIGLAVVMMAWIDSMTKGNGLTHATKSIRSIIEQLKDCIRSIIIFSSLHDRENLADAADVFYSFAATLVAIGAAVSAIVYFEGLNGKKDINRATRSIRSIIEQLKDCIRSIIIFDSLFKSEYNTLESASEVFYSLSTCIVALGFSISLITYVSSKYGGDAKKSSKVIISCIDEIKYMMDSMIIFSSIFNKGNEYSKDKLEGLAKNILALSAPILAIGITISLISYFDSKYGNTEPAMENLILMMKEIVKIGRIMAFMSSIFTGIDLPFGNMGKSSWLYQLGLALIEISWAVGIVAKTYSEYGDTATNDAFKSLKDMIWELGGIGSVLIAAGGFAGKIGGKAGTKVKSIKYASKTLISIGLAVLEVSVALAIVAGVRKLVGDPEEFKQASNFIKGAIVALGVVASVLLVVAGIFQSKEGQITRASALMISIGTSLLEVSVALGLVAYAYKTYGGDAITTALYDIGVMLFAMATVVAALTYLADYLSKGNKVAKIAGLSAGFIAIGFALMEASIAISAVAYVSSLTDGMTTQAMYDLAEMMFAMTIIIAAFAIIADRYKNVMVEVIVYSIVMNVLGIAMNVLAAALNTVASVYNKYKWWTAAAATTLVLMIVGLAAIVDAMAILGAKFKVKIPLLIASAAGVVVLSVALLPITKALETLGDIRKKYGNEKSIWELVAIAVAAVSGLGLILFALTSLTKVVSGEKPGFGAIIELASSGAILIISIGLEYLARALKQMQGLEWSTLGKAGAALTGIAVAIIVLMAAANALWAGALVIYGGLLAIAAALYIISAAFERFAKAWAIFKNADSINTTVTILENTKGEYKTAGDSIYTVAKEAGLKGPTGLVDGMNETAPKALKSVKDFIDEIIFTMNKALGISDDKGKATSKEKWKFYKIGVNIVQGLIDGIKSMDESLTTCVKDFAQSVIDTFNSTLKIESPSKVMEGSGKNTVEGFNNGIVENQDTTASTMEAFASDKVVKPVVDKIGEETKEGGAVYGAGGSMANAVVDGMNAESEKPSFFKSIGNFFGNLVGSFAGSMINASGVMDNIDISGMIDTTSIQDQINDSMSNLELDFDSEELSTKISEQIGTIDLENLNIDTDSIQKQIEESLGSLNINTDDIENSITTTGGELDLNKVLTNSGMSVDSTEVANALASSYSNALASQNVQNEVYSSSKTIADSTVKGMQTTTKGRNLFDAVVDIVDILCSTYIKSLEYRRPMLQQAFKGLIIASAKAAVNIYKIKEIGYNIMSGITNGIIDRYIKVKKTITGICSSIKNVFTSFFKIHSPSVVMKDIGKNIVDGIVVGIEDEEKQAIDSANNFAYVFNEQLLNSLGNILDYINSDFEYSPTITPVVNLDNVDYAKSYLDNEFSSGMSSRANVTFSRMKNERRGMIATDSSNQKTNTGTIYNYTQNNYSPKALSEIEIYRRTNDQLNFRKFVGG